MKKILIFLPFLLFCCCESQSQGYKIKLEIKGAENQELWFAHYYEDQYITVNQIKLDEKGSGLLSSDKKLDGGIYVFAFADTKYFDVLISDDQDFAISTDTTDLVMNMKIKGSEDNSILYEYQQQVVNLTNSKLKLENEKSLLTDSSKINEKEIEIALVNNKMADLWKQTAEKYPKSFFTVLLRAMHCFEAPEGEDPFSFVDFSDDRLIRTPFFYNIIRYHIATYIDETPDKIIKSNEELLKKCTNDTVYQYVATYLLNFYRTFFKIGINEVFCNLAENHFLNGKGYWLDSAAVKIISNQNDIYKSSNIGSDAFDFKVLTIAGDSTGVLDFDSEFRFLFFWSIGCGHCETAAETLKQNREKIEALNIDILGINNDGKNIEEWKKYLTKQNYLWLNGIDTSETSRYREYYYVCSTPLMFVIDKNHKIVNKMYGEDLIQNYIEYILNQ